MRSAWKVLAAGWSWRENLSVRSLRTAAVTMAANCLVEIIGSLSRARTIALDMRTEEEKHDQLIRINISQESWYDHDRIGQNVSNNVL